MSEPTILRVSTLLFAGCFAVLALLGACTNTTSAKELVLRDGARVTLNLRKVEQAKNPADALVYGTIDIRAQGKRIASVNLNCFSLSSRKFASDGIYVDSVAHILASDYRGRDGKVHVDVYWLFRHSVRDIDLADLRITLVADAAHDSCVKYEEKGK